MIENFDPNTIEEEGLRQVVIALMNLVETLSAKVAEQAEEIRRLRDEIRRLKGGTRHPHIHAKEIVSASLLGKRTLSVHTPPQSQ